MKKFQFAIVAALLLGLIGIIPVLAQAEKLTLKMSRDWGYGGFNGDIEGVFSMRATGPADLASVDFYIDGTKLGNATQAPFSLQFTTDNYPLGIHKLSAVGQSSAGQEYRSNTITANFVPKQSSTKVILPVLGAIVLVILLSTLVPFLASRSKHSNLPLGAERNYGVGGGGICPKCHRPFVLPLFSMHLGLSKFAPCPYCGKWSMVRVESLSKLREAEKLELEWGKPQNTTGPDESDKVQKDLDDSKYQDL